MSFPQSPHLVVGEGTQVGIITLWTKKEHVLKHIPKEQYAVCAQLYSRDEGISALIRSLRENPAVRDIILVGVDMNACATTLLALWNNGTENGHVIGAPGYIDTEIPSEEVDAIRTHVALHDLREEKNYARVSNYISQLEKKDAWAKPKTFPTAKITPPKTFPTAPHTPIRSDSIEQAATELAHMLARFETLYAVHVHLRERGKIPVFFLDEDVQYTQNLLENIPGTYGEHLHRNNRLGKLVHELTKKDTAVITFADDDEDPLLELIQLFRNNEGLHLLAHTKKTTLAELPLLANALFSLLDVIAGELDEPSKTLTISCGVLLSSRVDEKLREKAHVLVRQGDPKSNILIRIKEHRIFVTHLSPQGKRLEEFSGETAKELYKRLVVEHRITDLSHAAYLGYELARAEHALKTGVLYDQDG